ncbi:MAG TPA: AtpZ/AtpI family protein [Candidatus Methanoperedens sp.]|nr:AtpZ/AtpI family protein [Candidatus Methanoperedens sp.]
MTGNNSLKEKEHKEFIEKVGKKEERKMKARSEKDRNIWFGLGMMGLIGWSVAIPTLIGIALGIWIDTRFPGRISWTLTFFFVGLFLGCLNAWYWIERESKKIDGGQNDE